MEAAQRNKGPLSITLEWSMV